MKRASARELNEDAAPAVILQVSRSRLRELFPVRFSPVDPFAEAEPSIAALVQLTSGHLVIINFGTVTNRVTVSVPVSADFRGTVRALLREAGVQKGEVVWIADDVRGELRTYELVGSKRPQRRTVTGSRLRVTTSDHSIEDLRLRERKLREQLFKLRFQRATGRLENPLKLREVRREIARIESLLNERAKAKARS